MDLVADLRGGWVVQLHRRAAVLVNAEVARIGEGVKPVFRHKQFRRDLRRSATLHLYQQSLIVADTLHAIWTNFKFWFIADTLQFRIPFICDCRNLSQLLRRIREGAATIHTKGETVVLVRGSDDSGSSQWIWAE